MAPSAFPGAIRLLLLGAILTSISSCSPPASIKSRHNLEDLPYAHKRDGGFFSVLGVAGLGDSSVHPRLEIRELEKNADQWNVYLLGLRRFQSTTQGDRLSYYQIAGIHGRPYIPWDSVNQTKGGSGGYCEHSSNLFPTWHRPYLALHEELLYLNARQAIAEFPNGDLKDRYNVALKSLRMPYWDWAAIPPSGESSMPRSIQSPTINATLPNGTTIIDNPLYSYKFRPLNAADMGGAPWTVWPTTVRSPTSNDADAVSRNNLVALELDKNRPNLQSRVFNVLAMQHIYSDISNDLQAGDSLENVHDTIHNMVGGNGHLSWLAYAAFDPIFWLHHVNVDRMFAIWQELNPDSYVESQVNPYPTFTRTKSSVADIDTPLTPFHRNDAGQFWTSDDVRSTRLFAYTYPELMHQTDNNTSTLISTINALYGPDATSPQKRSIDPNPIHQPKLHPRRIAGAPTFSGQRQYLTNIKVQKFGLNGSFKIFIFLGRHEPGRNPSTWVKESSFIGVAGILSQPMGVDSAVLEVEAHGSVPLTAALEAKIRSGELKSMREGVVERFLNGHLRWRILTIHGEQIPVEAAPGFQVSVLWARIRPALSVHEFPKVVGEYQVLVNATDGRPGGFGRGDRLGGGYQGVERGV